MKDNFKLRKAHIPVLTMALAAFCGASRARIVRSSTGPSVITNLATLILLSAFSLGSTPALSAPDQVISGFERFGKRIAGGEERVFFIDGDTNGQVADWDGQTEAWQINPVPIFASSISDFSGNRGAAAAFIGQIEIYELVNGVWIDVDTLELPANQHAVDLDLEGEWLVVSTFDPVSLADHIRVYQHNGLGYAVHDTWSEATDFDRDFGAAVALHPSGQILLVGNPNQEGELVTGKVSRYLRNGPGWLWLEDLTDPQAQPGNRFGAALDLSAESRLVIGAPAQDGPSTPDSGKVFIYEPGALLDVHLVAEISGAQSGAALGSSVSILANAVLAGAPGTDLYAPPYTPAQDGGLAQRYWRRGDGSWTLRDTLAPAFQGGAEAGTSVALFPKSALLGAPGFSNDAGAVFSYLGSPPLFFDDFESGDLGAWTLTDP